MPYVHATVEQGTLRGIDNAGVVSFLGVPYGASTAGDDRFRPPRPAEPWDGVRDALAFGPSAPQTDLRLNATGSLAPLLTLLMPRAGVPTEGGAVDEDCLRLNVWAPSGRPEGSLPVLVWLHGGGYSYGSGNEMSFNGDVLAAAGDLVVVTVTHRLGLLGFLDLRELGEPGSANAGLLDIVAALEWVQRNVAVFGGDPARVTVCGQSGGSGKVAALNTMPRARDLFARSIMMSGPFGQSHSAADAGALRARTMDLAGLSTVDELRAAPVARLLDAQTAVLRAVAQMSRGDDARGLELDRAPGFGPSHDPEDLPGDSFGDEATDGVRGKQLLIGWTTHESSFLMAADPSYRTGMLPDAASARVDALADVDGVTYADLAAQFPDEAPHLLLARRMSRLMFHEPARRIAGLAAAKADGVWAYEFRQPTEVLGGLLGATHSLDLAYVFGTVDRIPLTGRSLDRHRVSRDMMRAWASFAHTGDPGWKPWASAEAVHSFGTSYGPDLRLPEDVDMSSPLAGSGPQPRG
ncbi:carboxylesterase family protein [Streptomyces sp. NPDC005827]|uniref:carboxylesterase/lipase family protein n=1 Tax=Streptomyces sp. NPDC005827 TaxID=3157070 RepID=UPI0033C68007